MKALVVYDSVYGNTEEIAKAIGGAISGDTKVVKPEGADLATFGTLELLIIGSPIHGGRPMPELQNLLDRIPEQTLKDIKVAAFDTRIPGKFAKIFGYAADRIADILVQKGGTLTTPPEGFIVKGKKGPLKEGELNRAATWAKGIGQ
jgi:flavodoxin I